MTKEAVGGHLVTRQMQDMQIQDRQIQDRQIQDRQIQDRQIQEQPRVLARLLLEAKSRSRAVAKIVRRRGPKFVLLAARGTADHSAVYAKHLFEVNLGWPAGLVTPAAMTGYGSRLDLCDVLMVAIGEDGSDPDLIRAVRMASSGGATTVAITNSPESELAKAARLHIDTMVGLEVAVSDTKSYPAQLLALWLLVDALRGGDGRAAARLPDAAGSVLTRAGEVAALAARYQFVDRLVTTGCGYSYPTAREAARSFTQTASVPAQAFSGADLLHGPLAMIDQGHPVIAVVPDGRGAESMRSVLERLSDRGADVAVVGGRQAVPMATVSFDVGCPDLVEELHPVIDIIVLQLLALELARVRGMTSDPALVSVEMALSQMAGGL